LGLNRNLVLGVGVLLIVVAVVLFAVQHFEVYNLYGDVGYKWYFYGLVGVVGVAGLVLAAWAFMKGE